MNAATVLGFLGVQGGCGTTSAAIAQAAELTGSVLVDADLGHGDIAERLGVPAAHPGSGWLSDPEPLRARGGQLVAVSPSNVLVAEAVGPEEVAHNLAKLANAHPLVVDLGSRIDAATAQLIRICARIVLVCDGRAAQPRLAAAAQDLCLRLGVSEVRLAAPRIPQSRTRRLFAARCGVPLREAPSAASAPVGPIERLRTWAGKRMAVLEGQA